MCPKIAPRNFKNLFSIEYLKEAFDVNYLFYLYDFFTKELIVLFFKSNYVYNIQLEIMWIASRDKGIFLF